MEPVLQQLGLRAHRQHEAGQRAAEHWIGRRMGRARRGHLLGGERRDSCVRRPSGLIRRKAVRHRL